MCRGPLSKKRDGGSHRFLYSAVEAHPLGNHIVGAHTSEGRNIEAQTIETQNIDIDIDMLDRSGKCTWPLCETNTQSSHGENMLPDSILNRASARATTITHFSRKKATTFPI